MLSPSTAAIDGSATSRIVRRRPAEKRAPITNFAGASPLLSGDDFASGAGTTFRAFSLIVLNQFGLTLRVVVAERGAQVVLHDNQIAQQSLLRFGIDAVEGVGHDLQPRGAEPLEHRTRGWGQIEAVGAAVVGVGPPLDQLVLGQGVEEAGGGE